MHSLYLLARIYPYWALPLGLVLGEVGIYFRRKKNSVQYYFLLQGLLLLIGLALWIGFRGDLHSDEWVRSIF